jgi:ubiquinone/menaquinone biosynthesis C-methylase UbiE
MSHKDATDDAKWNEHVAYQMAQEAYLVDKNDRMWQALMSEPWFSLLDFGCGSGLWSRYLYTEGARYVGVDRNPNMIEAARTRWASEPSRAFVLCDVLAGEPLPFPNGDFDVAVTIAVLQHNDLDEKPKVLAEIRRVLRRYGRLLMYETTYGPFNPGHTAEDSDDHCHSQAGWRTVVEPHGFVCVRQERDFHVFQAI